MEETDYTEMARTLLAILMAKDGGEDEFIDILTDENYSDADIAEFIQWIEY